MKYLQQETGYYEDKTDGSIVVIVEGKELLRIPADKKASMNWKWLKV